MPVLWRNDLSVGCKDIDNDHKNWLNVVNVVSMGVDSGDVKLVKKAMDDAVEYSRQHFYREEKLMKNISYPYYEEHFEIHSTFIEKINDFQTDMNMNMDYHPEEAMKIGKKFATFTRNWLLSHIKNEDSKISPFINNKCDNLD
ncbi:MAG: bacteriohemerythrin [Alphaproteobacteria bacterium]